MLENAATVDCGLRVNAVERRIGQRR